MKEQVVICCESRRKAIPYVAALAGLGLEPERLRVIAPDQPADELPRRGRDAAGVVLCGGPDLEPRHYGEAALPEADLSLLPELDRMDLELLAGARQGRTPVWAICRGMQTVNVFQGGTLWQDIYTQVEGVMDHSVSEPEDAFAHRVEVVARRESFGEILGRREVLVNSRHHQAVKHLGSGLIAVARSPDGLTEVLALDSQEWWVKGVQWHPENLVHLSVQRRLWAEFIDAAAAKAS